MTDWLEEIRARAEKATPGPWTWVGDEFEGEEEKCPHGYEWTNHGPSLEGKETIVLHEWGYDASGLTITRPDADFIAHSREDIPRLIAEVERLLQVVDACEELKDEACERAVNNDEEIARLREALVRQGAEFQAFVCSEMGCSCGPDDEELADQSAEGHMGVVREVLKKEEKL